MGDHQRAATNSTGADLHLHGLRKRYGDVRALDDVSLTIEPGELFGFVGSNGAGKTTAMRIILGVLEPDAGRVSSGGRELDLDARRSIGYMPEERGLYPKMAVGEQLTWMAELRGLDRSAALRAARSWCERLEVDTRWDDPVDELSLGNQQRVQLAAALVHGPSMLVLDEPFSGLDPVAVDVMSSVLRDQAAQGVPVLFSSHQLDLVERLCDRVGIIRGGRIVACDTVDALRAGDGDRRIEIDVSGAPPSWAEELIGARVVERRGRRTVVELDPGADDQQVLQAALAHGPVHEFAQRRPTLTERFRHVVHEGDPLPAAAASAEQEVPA